MKKRFLLGSMGCAFTAGLGIFLAGCEMPQRPSNLSISEADSQRIQNDRIQETQHAQEVVANVRKALEPVQAILSDLSNVTGKVDARIAGKSINDLHLADGFKLIGQMLQNSDHSGIIRRSKRGPGWTIRQSFTVDPSIQLQGCNQATVELEGKRAGGSDELSLNLIECNSPQKILVADIQVNGDTIRAALHLENLKDLSFSTRAGTACSLQIGTAGGVLSSSLDCEPMEITIGSNRVEVSPLSLYAETKGINGKVGVHAFDSSGNEFLMVSYPKSETAKPSAIDAITDLPAANQN